MTNSPQRTSIQPKELLQLGFIGLVAIAIFYPVSYADYLFADEAIQLWNYKPEGPTDFSIAIRQGRLLTEYIYVWAYGAIDTVHQLTWLRIFALISWLVCLPVWYYILRSLVKDRPGFAYLPFFTCLYLVTSMPFSVSVHWSVCLELSLANTLGLLSGYMAYKSISYAGRIKIAPSKVAGAFITGVLALFTYQSGFCCFVVPFLIHLLVTQFNKKEQWLMIGLAYIPLICIVYFPLFKLSMVLTHTDGFNRTNIHLDPIHKLEYFFTHPFKRSFWFNIIVDENNKLARAIYKIMFAGWIVLSFVRSGKKYIDALKYVVAVQLLFLCAYFPSLIIAENFASNRSQLALDICVWLVWGEMAIYFIRNQRALMVTGITAACILIISGWTNFRNHFLRPVTTEYALVKDYIKSHYHAGIRSIYFIKLQEDAFRNTFHVRSSMDEFGVAAGVFDWTVEFLPRQLVFEMTGKRQAGEQLHIKHWPDAESFSTSGETITNNVLMVDLPALLDQGNAKH
jgi:hypothetical protein